LVVGISSYEDSRFRTLRAPARDVRDLAGVLADPRMGGFRVTTVLDATAQELRVAVHDFLAARKRDETVVLYLSCHGLLTRRRDLYFVASDTQQDRLAATALEARWLNDRLDDCDARSQLVILDCCFSGAFTSAKDAANSDLADRLQEAFSSADSATDPVIIHEVESRGRTVLTASRATEYSFEGTEPTQGVSTGSVFTAALVDGIRSGGADKNNDGLVSAGEAYDYAHARVRADNKKQHPQIWRFGGEGADVVLARSYAGISVTPAEIPPSLQQQLLGPYPSIRIAAVEELGKWLLGDDPARVISARACLTERADQEIAEVAQKIRWYLNQDDTNASLATAPVNLEQNQVPGQQGGYAAILQNAERIARGAVGPHSAALGLTMVSLGAERAALANSTDLSSEAERLARGIPDLYKRSMTLAAMGQVLAASDQRYARRLNDRAESFARDIEKAQDRIMALARVAETAAAYDPEQAADLASEIAPEVDREWDAMLSLAYGAIVTELGRHDPQRASKAARVRVDQFDRNHLLLNLVESVSHSSAAAAQRIAASLSGDYDEVSALIILASGAAAKSPAYSQQFVREALRVARAIPETDVRVSALARITEAVASFNPDHALPLLTEVAQLAHSLPEGKPRIWALSDVGTAQARIALLLVATDPEAAEKLAASIEGLPRYKVLCDILPLIAGKDRIRAERMIQDAERNARTITDGATQVLALAWVTAAAVAIGYQYGPQLADEVERLIPNLPDDGKTVVSAKLAAAIARSDLDHAERIASTIPREATKARVLAGLAQQVARTDLDHAERIASTIPREATKARVLAGLAQQVSATDPDRAARIAGTITEKSRKSDALAKIADILVTQVIGALGSNYSTAE
jgi:hypothetical protein